MMRYLERVKDLLKLKNFTILSILLLCISFIPIIYPSYQNKELFQSFLEIGCVCLVISYFIYAIEHWSSHNRLFALFMVTVPLIAAYLSTTNIPDPTNVLIYFTFAVGICAVISAILLVIGEKIYWMMRKYIFKIKSKNHWYSLPKITYAILGMVCVSFIIINLTSVPVFSDNLNVLTHSITSSIKNSQTGSTSPVTYVTQYPTISQYSTISVPQTKPTILSTITIPPKNLETGFTPKSFTYVLRGKSGSIDVNLYSGIYNEISSQPSPVWCTRYDYDSSPCTSEETQQYYLKYLDNPVQKKYLDGLVLSIKSTSSNKDDQARIAISMVQQIPYDNSRLYLKNCYSSDLFFFLRITNPVR